MGKSEAKQHFASLFSSIQAFFHYLCALLVVHYVSLLVTIVLCILRSDNKHLRNNHNQF